MMFKNTAERRAFEEAVVAILAQEHSYREAGRYGVCGEAGNPNCTEEC
jgi:hypothetical protein